jgi:hypothetical protein
MSGAEYWGAVACLVINAILVKRKEPFNPWAFTLASVIALGFAYHKGVVQKYGFCPVTQTFLTIMFSAILGFLWGVVVKATSPEGYAPESGLFKLILGAGVIFAGPLLVYAVAANFTMNTIPSCKDMFATDLKDYIYPGSP